MKRYWTWTYVAVRQIVYHKETRISRRRTSLVGGADVPQGLGHQGRDLGSSVSVWTKEWSVTHPSDIDISGDKRGRNRYSQPEERGNLGHLSGLRRLGRRQRGDGIGRDLGRVEGVGPLLHAGEGVPRVAGGGAGPRRRARRPGGGGRRGGRGRGGPGSRRRRRYRYCAAARGPGEALAVVVVRVRAYRAGGAAGRAREAYPAALAAGDIACQFLQFSLSLGPTDILVGQVV